MRKIILYVLAANDEPLFEYISFRKQRQSAEPYMRKAFKKFHAHISANTPRNPDSSKKQVVIKNIGNMKRSHLSNALGYCLKNSALSALLLESNLDSGLAFNHLSELVGYEQILDDWSKDFSKHPNVNEALHLVFSLNEVPSQSALEILQCAVRESMQANMPEYKWVMIPHSHQNRPHIHVIINKTNIFSKKKLHFSSKLEIAEFFHILREDFVQNLFTYSQGRLDYTNETMSKDFRVNLLRDREAVLDEIAKESAHTHDSSNLIDDMAYISMQQQALNSLTLKRKPLYLLTKSLEKELKNTKIYHANVEKKLQNLQAKQTNQVNAQGNNAFGDELGKRQATHTPTFTPTKLLARRENLEQKITSLQQQITSNKTKIQELDSGIKQLVDSSESFSRFTKHFSTLHKKKALLSSCKGFERYLSKDLITKLSSLKQEVAHSQVALKYHFNDLSASVLQSPKSSRRTIFALSKQLGKLTRFKGVLDVIGEQELESNQKAHTLNEIERMEQELKQQIQARFMRLLDSGLESKQNLEAFAKAVCVESGSVDGSMPLSKQEIEPNANLKDSTWFDKVQLHLRLHKKHLYLQKELGFGLKVCARHGIALESLIANAQALKALGEPAHRLDSGLEPMLLPLSLPTHTTKTLQALESTQESLQPASKPTPSSPESKKHLHSTQSLKNNLTKS